MLQFAVEEVAILPHHSFVFPDLIVEVISPSLVQVYSMCYVVLLALQSRKRR